MKTLLTILLFVFGLNGYGQTSDSLFHGSYLCDTCLMNYNYNYNLHVTWSDTLLWSRQDTTKVLMLVCDTSLMVIRGVNAKGDEEKFFFHDPATTWQIGYRVVSFASSPYFLDELKFPLSKNIVIWNYKFLRDAGESIFELDNKSFFIIGSPITSYGTLVIDSTTSKTYKKKIKKQ